MNVGDMVRFTVRDGEPPSPAIVLGVWETGEVQLYVFHFEANSHVRAAHPSQVEEVNQSSHSEEITALEARLSDLENEVHDLRVRLHIKSEPPQVIDVDSTPIDLLDELEPAPLAVAAPAKKKKASSSWPNES